MSDKLGVYITKLMTTVLDKEADEFVRNLAWGELKRINADVGSFILKHSKYLLRNLKTFENRG